MKPSATPAALRLRFHDGRSAFERAPGLRWAACCGLSVAAMGAAAPPAAAQAVFDEDLARVGAFARDRSISVRERPQPAFASLPYRTGAFLVAPRIAVGAEATDNVFRSRSGEQADLIVQAQPSASVRSAWSRHGVEAVAQATRRQFLDAADESTTDGLLSAVGRLDVRRGAAVQAGASVERVTEPRSAPESPEAAAEPVQYDLRRTFVGGAWTWNRLRAAGQLGHRQTRFDDLKTRLGEPLPQGGRDRNTTVASGRAEYGVTPAVALSGVLAVNRRTDPNRPAGDPDRGSRGYELLAGADFDIGGLARGSLAAGYLEQDYDDPALPDPSGLALRAEAEYFPSPLVTLRADADRRVEDTVRAGAGSFVNTTASVRADYELLRWLVLSASAEWSRDDYQGVDRTNDRWTSGVGAEYRVNRSWAFSLSYEHQNQRSDGAQPGREFTANRLLATVVRQFGVN